MRPPVLILSICGIVLTGIACRRPLQAAGEDVKLPSLLVEKYAHFEGVQRSDYTYGEDLVDIKRAGFFCFNGVPNAKRVALTFAAEAARHGATGEHIVLKDPQGNGGDLAFRFPLQEPLRLQKGDERTLLLRFWARGECHPESGSYTKVIVAFASGDEKFAPRAAAESPVTIEPVRMPGAPQYVSGEARYIPEWVLLGGT